MFYPVLANDTPVVRYTNGAAGATTSATPLNDALYASVTTNMTKLPYTTAQLASGNVEARFISGCIRVRYSGKESNRAGTLILLETPDHEDIFPLSFNDINQYEATTTTRPTGEGEWSQINWSGPVKTGELEYRNTPTASGVTVFPAGTWSPHSPIVIAIAGGDATIAQQFNFEAWVNVEYIGKIAVGKTPGDADVVGFGKTQQAIKNIAATEALSPDIGTKVLTAVNKAVNFAGSQEGKMLFNNVVNTIRGSRSGSGSYANYRSTGIYNKWAGHAYH